MRTFIIKINHPLEDFELNNLTQNRVDMAARIVNAAFWIDHAIRRGNQLYLCFQNNKTLHYKPPFRNMNPDERNIASFIKHVLEGRKFQGIRLVEKTFEQKIKEEQNEGKELVFLDATGEDIQKQEIGKEVAFVLGDDKGYGDYEIPNKAKKISIGSKSYLASHCISYLNIYLDSESK